MRISDWSSDVCSSDLLCAADYLRQEHQAPAILIGHSLGGAAVLAAAGEVPEARAVATIAAPADAVHVVENFKADLSTIEQSGMAVVTLAGRKRSEEHTSELLSLMRISSAVFCLKKKTDNHTTERHNNTNKVNTT